MESDAKRHGTPAPIHRSVTRPPVRLHAHVAPSHYSASIAFKRARRILSMGATYKPEDSRNALVADAVHGPISFTAYRRRIGDGGVLFRDRQCVRQYLLELYACMELSLPWTSSTPIARAETLHC